MFSHRHSGHAEAMSESQFERLLSNVAELVIVVLLGMIAFDIGAPRDKQHQEECVPATPPEKPAQPRRQAAMQWKFLTAVRGGDSFGFQGVCDGRRIAGKRQSRGPSRS